MKIGILGAMPEEISLIQNLLEQPKKEIVGNRTYYQGTLGQNEVISTFSRWGKVASSSTATTLINIFDVDLIIFTGVAGAVKQDINIGDVVIAQALYQHDLDARPLYDQFQIPMSNLIYCEPSKEFSLKAFHASNLYLDYISEQIPTSLLSKYSISIPRTHRGIIASGDKFVSDPVREKNLSLTKDGFETLAVEMEGAAVAQVCCEYNIPFVVIRTISDRADHNAAFNFQSFIADIAGQYSAGIVKEFCSQLIS